MNMLKTIIVSTTLACSVALTGCGGSSDSSTTNTETPTTTTSTAEKTLGVGLLPPDGVVTTASSLNSDDMSPSDSASSVDSDDMPPS